jgi:hypothetical protein
VGQWVEDKASGEGVLEQANGDVYDGEWLNDLRHGYGKFISSSTSMRYEGYWSHGFKVSEPCPPFNDMHDDMVIDRMVMEPCIS